MFRNTFLPFILFVVAALIAATPVATCHAEDQIRDSVVKIHVTSRSPDFLRPWTKLNPRKSSGSGAIISGNRILTNNHVVRYAKQIFVQFNQSTDRHPARVVAKAPGMDLAVLEMEDGSLIEGRPALELQEGIPEMKSTVNVYGFPMGGDDLAITEGIVSRIEYGKLSGSGAGLRIQVDAALNPGNSGGPALIGNSITGLVYSGIREADNIGYLINAKEIQRFLDDIEDGNYDGKPNIFDSLQTLENESLRAKLGLTAEQTGIMVKSPYQDGGEYPLKPWDVICKVGDYTVDNKGQVKVRDDLRLMFHYFIPELVVDGKVPVTVYRDAKEVQVEVPVMPYRDLVLRELKGAYPRHFIFGPAVFTVASRDVVQGLGTKGLSLMSQMNSVIISRNQSKPEFPGEEIVLLRLLPHRITKGYDTIPFGVVTHVNDEQVKNLKDLVIKIRDCKDEFLILTMDGNYETLVFNRADMSDSTEEILGDEGIRYQYSKEFEPIWEGKEDTAAANEAGPVQDQKEEATAES